MLKTCSAALLALTLTACGGGGGSPGATTFTVNGKAGDPNVTALTQHAPALTFSPAKVSASFFVNAPTTVSLTATVTTPDDFNGASAVYAFLIDGAGVLDGNPQIYPISDFQYRINLTTNVDLKAGTYTGNFSVRLCKDKACNTQFPGSPVALPYEIVAKARS